MTTEIDQAKTKHYQKQWRDLQELRATVDYEMALFSRQVRSEFPLGPSGALQFRAWCREHLHVTGTRARMMVDAAAFLATGFVTPEGWIAIGGWASATFLMGLPPAARRNVYRGAVQRAATLQHPITMSTVRVVAAEQGIITKRPGRPNRSQTEAKLSLLRDWLTKLYAVPGRRLPPIPPAVRKAMELTLLDVAARAARATPRAA